MSEDGMKTLEQMHDHLVANPMSLQVSDIMENAHQLDQPQWMVMVATLLNFVAGAHCCVCNQHLANKPLVYTVLGTKHMHCEGLN